MRPYTGSEVFGLTNGVRYQVSATYLTARADGLDYNLSSVLADWPCVKP